MIIAHPNLLFHPFGMSPYPVLNSWPIFNFQILNKIFSSRGKLQQHDWRTRPLEKASQAWLGGQATRRNISSAAGEPVHQEKPQQHGRWTRSPGEASAAMHGPGCGKKPQYCSGKAIAVASRNYLTTRASTLAPPTFGGETIGALVMPAPGGVNI